MTEPRPGDTILVHVYNDACEKTACARFLLTAEWPFLTLAAHDFPDGRVGEALVETVDFLAREWLQSSRREPLVVQITPRSPGPDTGRRHFLVGTPEQVSAAHAMNMTALGKEG